MRVPQGSRRGGKVVAGLLVGLLVGGAGVGGYALYKGRDANRPGADAALEPADELAMVPADALGFVHVRAADLLKTDALAEIRRMIEAAGPDALKNLDDAFIPAPSAVRRLTVVVYKPATPADPPAVVVLVALAAPVDREKFQKANLPNATQGTVGDKEYWYSSNKTTIEDAVVVLPGKFPDAAVHYATDRLIVVGTVADVKAHLAAAAKADGPLAPAIKRAADGSRHAVAALNVVHVPKAARKALPSEFGPLLDADVVTLDLVVGKEARADVKATYKDVTTAEAAERAVTKMAENGKKAAWDVQVKFGELVKGKVGEARPRPNDKLPEAVIGMLALGPVNDLERWLSNPNVKRDGAELAASVTVPGFTNASLLAAGMTVGLIGEADRKPDTTFRHVGNRLAPRP